MGRRVAQHSAVIEAAKAAGVALLAYTSLPNADTAQIALAAEHRATEGCSASPACPFTFLRNSWYLENYIGQLPTYLEHGVVGATRGGKISAATRADYADAAAAALLADDSAGHVFELGGESFTLADLAATVASVSRQDVPAAEVTPEQLAGILVGAGIPEPYAHVLVSADEGIARGELEVTSGDLERLIGRPPTTLHEAVTAALAA